MARILEQGEEDFPVVIKLKNGQSALHTGEVRKTSQGQVQHKLMTNSGHQWIGSDEIQDTEGLGSQLGYQANYSYGNSGDWGTPNTF